MKIKNTLLTAIVTFSFAITSNAQTVPSNVPTNGLVGWWSFDGNANDSSGNNLDGNVIGSTALTNDRFGQANSAYDFDYVNATFGQQNDEIYIPYDDILNVNNITVSVWLNPRQYFWNGDSNNPNSTIINRFQYGYSNPNGETWGIVFSNSNLQAYIIDASNNSEIVSYGSQIALNTWHHIVFSYDGANLKLYLNGVLVNSVSTNIILNTTGNSGISIGESNQANGYWTHTDGIIDDIGIWDRALTEQEITNLYDDSTICMPDYIPSNGLVGFFPFCGNANDSSGNNLDGNVIGSTALTNDRFGQANSAYDFDYVNATFGQQNDEIYIPYDDILNVNNITVSVWLNPRQYFWNGDSNNPNSTIINRFQYGYSNPNGETWGIVFSNSNLQAYIIDASNNSEIVSYGSQIALNTWHHIVFSYDGANLKLYLNGVLVNSVSTNIILNTTGNSGISIGESNQANGYWTHTDGIIDDIGIWDRALTEQEVDNIFNGTTLSSVEFDKEKIVKLYPNPVENNLHLNVKNNYIGLRYDIYNSLGMVVNSGTLDKDKIINMDNLSKGLYFLKIQNINITHKIIKN